MTGNQDRRSVPDRARRRAIRAHAAKLGVSYSVAARLLRGHVPAPGAGGRGGVPGGADEHRQWLFALRESRSFALRVSDTRLAADLPSGRASHLTERFPRLRHPRCGTLYDGDSRQATLAMLFAVVAHESPALMPTADELGWIAELGEEDAVDFTCAAVDRAARLLLDGDRWRLWTRIEAALVAGEADPDRRVRDPATTLGREFRTVSLRRSLDGARHTLDAVLAGTHAGHPPGTPVRILAGPGQGRAATVVGLRWRRAGPPVGYEVRAGTGTTLGVPVDGVALLDQPAASDPALA